MVRKLLLGLGALLGLVVIVVLIRASSAASVQLDVDPVELVPVDTDAVVGRLSDVTRMATISHMNPEDFDPAPFAEFRDYVARAFPLVHERLELEPIHDYSLLYRWPGSDASLKPIVLVSHIDVVPVVPGTEDGWDHPPYSGAVDNGFVYGRGTLDDKVSVMAILEAVEMRLAEGFEPARTVYLSFGHDEEIGGALGAQTVAALLAERGVEAEFVIDEGGAVVTGVMAGIDGPVATIGVAEKGYLTVNLTARTRGGHSSQPPAQSAIGILSRAIVRLEENQVPGGVQGLTEEMFQAVGPEMDFGMRALLSNLWLFGPLVESELGKSQVMNAFLRTTTAPTIINGGTKDNVLPPSATASVNFRLMPGDTHESVMAHIRRVVNDDRVELSTQGFASEPTAVSPSSGAQFETIARTIREVIPGTIVAPYLVLGGTDARHYGAVSDAVYRFYPLQLEAEDLSRMHGTNERVAVDSYVTAIQWYHRLLENAAGG